MVFFVRRTFTPTSLFRMLAVVTLAMSLFSTNAISLVLAACTVSGTVYRDYNANGIQDAREPGVAGITVTAYSATAALASATTGADGTYTLNVGGTDPEVRIEFSGLPPYLRSGPFGGQSDTTVTFVPCAGPVGGVDLGTANPGEYCHDANNLNLATSCYAFGNQALPPFQNLPAVISFPYDAGTPAFGNPDQPPHDDLASIGEVGSTWGLAYQRSTDTLFASAFMKRHSGFGPLGSENPGTIYRINNAYNPPGTPIVFTTLNAGSNPHPGPTTNFAQDPNSFDEVGKRGLGDIDISDDDQTLYAMNLFDRRIYIIPIANPGAATSVAIPLNQADCPSPATNIRPFGLGVNDGRVFVGMVCTAETTGNRNQLRGYVYAFTPPGGAFTQVLNFPMNPTDYPRECVDNTGNPGCPSARWNPWTPVWQDFNGDGQPVVPSPGFAMLPQPWITDITFDNGDMIIGVRDRFGDQQGNVALTPTLNPPGNYSSIGSGDVLRACANGAGSWTLESNGTCGGVTTSGVNNGQGPGNGEFYAGDNHVFHSDVSLGGIVQVPGFPDMALSVMDPVFNETFDAGMRRLNNTTGATVGAYRVYNGSGGDISTFGKANGLSDLEAMCGPAPLEIGNRVWEDLDRNGRQDPNELKLAGVTLQLWMDTDGNGTVDTQVGTTQTNAQGEYIFNEANVFNPGDPNTFFDIDNDGTRDPNEPAGILPNSTYEVRVLGGTNYDPGGVLENYFATTVNRGGVPSDMRDSDGLTFNPAAMVSATNYPRAVVRTGDFGENDHTWDFGFSRVVPPRQQPTPPPPGGGGTPVTASITKSVNPPFAMPGDTMTWTITVTNPNPFPLTNVVVTDTMPNEVEIISASATDGNVSFSGQTVTFNQATMDPGASVTITVVTRVRANASVPFNISNLATLTATELPNPLTASANVVSVGELPGTGESPWSRWRLPILALIGGIFVLTGVWVWRRARR